MSTIAELEKISSTAKYTLQMRAMATVDPKWNTYFQDKWAVKFTGGETDVVDKYDPDRKTYPAIILRSILIDRFLEKFVHELDIAQIVLFAAGYDTRSDRLRLKTSKGKNVTYFEVDLESTQNDKKQILKEFNYPTDNVNYVAFDLSKGNPFEELRKRGFNNNNQAIFVIEGLSMYLAESQIKNLLSTIYNNMKNNVIVIFDYFIREVKSVHPDEPFKWYSANPVEMLRSLKYKPWLYGMNFMHKDMFGSVLPTASSVAIGYGFYDKVDLPKIREMPKITPIYDVVEETKTDVEPVSDEKVVLKPSISYISPSKVEKKLSLSQSLKVCIVQYNPNDSNKQLNMKKIELLLEKRLGSEKCDMIVLPELSLTKYFFTGKEEALEYADEISMNNTVVKWMSSVSKRYNTYLFCGVIEYDTNLYNTMVITDREGNLLSKYRKCKLFDVDKNWATPGKGFNHINIPEYGNIGLGICMDISTEDWSQKSDISTMDFASYMDKNNINIIVFISAVLFSKPEYKYPYYQQLYWNSRLRPLFNQSPIFIGVNRVNEKYCGSSCIMRVDDNPNIMLSFEYDEEDAKVYTL